MRTYFFISLKREKKYHILNLHFTIKTQNKMGWMGMRPSVITTISFVFFRGGLTQII